MTARGIYLKALVDPATGRTSIRKLAARLSDLAAMPDEAETIRRTLQRHIAEPKPGQPQREISDDYVVAISKVLGLDSADWPAATPPPTKAALRQRVADLERELERVRHGDPPAPAQDGEQ